MDGIESIGAPQTLPLDSRVVLPDLLDGAPGSGLDHPKVQGQTSSSAPGVDRSDEQKRQIAKDFESVLLGKLFDEVQESIGNLDLGQEEDGTSQQVHGLFWLYLARDIADKGGLGLWKDVYEHLKQMDGAGNPAGVLDEEL